MLLKNTKEGLLVLDKQKLVSIRSSEYDFIENNKIIAIHSDPKKTFLKVETISAENINNLRNDYTYLEKKELIEVTLANGAVLKSNTAILALGATWRNINVPGEEEFRNKGVTYCPHCDGPLFEGKNVAVIGGGNSGLEAALDLAGITKHVTVLEFLPELKADQVLQERAAKTDNLTILKNVATKEIVGQGHVTGLNYVERDTNEEKHLDLEGVFVQIGLVPSTAWLKDSGIELNERQEIIVDKFGSTNIPGIFAAGDCTDSAYKQIIISMGSGATAAIGAFDYLIRQ